MRRNEVNYWVDVGIGLAFALSAVSGLVFLLPVASVDGRVLGLSYPLWSNLHTWSSLALIAGVLLHLVLHWRWIVTMTRRTVAGDRTVRSPAGARVERPASRLSRRGFLALGLAAALTGICAAIGLLAGGERSSEAGASPEARPDEAEARPEARADETEANPDVGGDAPKTPTPTGVACPRGIVNDPYPGHCRNYTDRDGDGICDYSVPGSGPN